MALSVHETLKAMRELLSDEKRWTKRAFARDFFGHPVPIDDENAICWCLLSAAVKSTPPTEYMATLLTITKLFDGDMVNFNDTHTHAEVLAKLDDAIKATAP